MAESKKPADLVKASFEALDRYEEAQEAVAEDSDRPPAPGDVYVLEATKDFDVEWAVLVHDPADPPHCLVVPADGHVLGGSADVETEDDSPSGALKLRCRFGTWTDTRFLRPELRVGVLKTEDLIRARQCWLDLGDGKVTGGVVNREVDDEPGYQDWVDDVLVPARRKLIDVHGTGETPQGVGLEPEKKPVVPSTRRPMGPVLLWVAASIALVIGTFYLWRLQERVKDLLHHSKVAERFYHSEIDRLESKLRQPFVVRQLLIPEKLPGTPKGVFIVNVERTAESTVIMKLDVSGNPSGAQYRLELYSKEAEERLWLEDGLAPEEGGVLWISIPVDLLSDRRYELQVDRVIGGTSKFHSIYEIRMGEPD